MSTLTESNQLKMKNTLLLLSLVFHIQSILFSQTGTLDPAFGLGGIVSTPAYGSPETTAWGAEIDENGKILIGGNAHLPYIVRYLPSGKRDSSFAEHGMLIYDKFWPKNMKALPNGKILLFGEMIARLNADGSDDPTFQGILPNGATLVSDAVSQADGKILLALSGSVPPFNQYCVARYLENGALDLSFGQNGLAHNASEWSGEAIDMTVQSDGKILVIGNNGREKRSMARYLADGTLDLGFGDNGVLVWGEPLSLAPQWYLEWGGDTLGEFPISKKMLVQPDGKILVAVQESMLDTLTYFAWMPQVILYRMFADGTPDASFGTNGVCRLADARMVFDIFLQEGDMVQLAVGAEYNEALWQLLPNGAIDGEFEARIFTINGSSDNQGMIDFAQQADGKIVAAYSYKWQQQYMSSWLTQLFATRLLANGTDDPDFGSQGWGTGLVSDPPTYRNDQALKMAVQPDGKTLLLGTQPERALCYNTYIWYWISSIRRFSPDGVLDPSWSITASSLVPNYTPCNSNTTLEGVIALPEGKSLVAYTHAGPSIARFNANAQVDSTFGVNGRVGLPWHFKFRAFEIQPDGKILLAVADESQASFLFRFTSAGEPDIAFGTGGKADLGQIGLLAGIAVFPNGKIALAGRDGKVVQLTSSGQFDPSFNAAGVLELPLSIRSIASHPSGKTLLGLRSNGFEIARINLDGSGLDPDFGGGDGIVSFNTSGEAAYCNSMAFQADGKIVATGTDLLNGKNLYLARFSADGQPDLTFNGTGLQTTDIGYGFNVPTNVALQPNGKIIVGATIGRATGSRISLLRYFSGQTVGTEHPEQQPQTAAMALPNPFSSSLHLDFSNLPAAVSQVDVFDLSGRPIYQAQAPETLQMELPESRAWAPGIYLLRATAGAAVFVQKVVKQ
jgi:uncharacterized delta-60 repeat protein